MDPSGNIIQAEEAAKAIQHSMIQKEMYKKVIGADNR